MEEFYIILTLEVLVFLDVFPPSRQQEPSKLNTLTAIYFVDVLENVYIAIY